ncbi:PTS system N-acetylgalactosamine-specific EIIC component, Man family (TC 4.A.6.1.4) [Clostridium cavendishii DSM 21758]|uniref:PTS system N-acetylgalactosamine-specific EIIC component, Man family (TC 4.A.6.1.4) n=1 Tax=Clostridium cavendishii DSM 21758 TaxID=1121302 RepID=A0A1M6H400_9CLOT|nr:PTS N-acetylgalactosamine transporter subunit IIC [Clostridium cavendishii]SHJ16856.1 PTS system N-acetylgalactosamine-specific EIIC component, Man family (TC 4.A.6.1.4) [Clostridium cavendishii DSM 21758]
MHVSFLQVILIAIWAGIAGVDHFDGLTHIHRPLVTGLVIGLILGDVKQGIIIGAALELVWMGLVPLAGAQPPNIVMGGVIGVSAGLILDLKPEQAIAVAFPFAVAVELLVSGVYFTVNSLFMPKVDKMCENADYKGVERLNYLTMLFLFVLFFVVAFIPVYLGADKGAELLAKIPSWFMEGLQVGGGMCIAVGIAVLLKIMLKKEYIVFFILGYVLVSYAHFDIVPVTLSALIVALYDYYKGGSSSSETVAVKEEFEDGI